MRARLIALATAILLFILPLQSGVSAMDTANPNGANLPTVLEDELFDDLPFEQLRQELREEVERDPRRTRPPSSPQQYNWLIR